MKKLLTLFFVILVFAFVQNSNAAIRYVTTTGAGSKNGTSWSNAYEGLQTALNTASSGDQIWVAKGTYKPSYDYGLGGGSRYYHFRMINGVSIYGGFAGTETSVSQRTNFGEGQTNETILSGDIGIEGNNSDNCYHVFYHPDGLGLNNTAILDGFTIKGGNANGSDPHNIGGGIYNYSCSPTIKNCTITSNSAFSYGGGMYNRSSSPSISNCLFTSNSVYKGGGIFNYSNSSPTITNCTITSNSADADGGGMYNWSSSPTINNSIIWGNTATNGKQFYLNSGTTTLNYSCYANGTSDVYNSGGTFTTTNNNITSDPKFAGSVEIPYLLVSTSPCLDAGNNTYISEDYDIRGAGYSRKLNKTTGGAGTVDMGAYEYKVNVDPLYRILYVTTTGAGSKNGTSWSNAYEGLQTALNTASSGDQIWVAKGTYKPSYDYGLGGGSRYYHFRMINGVSIYGGFAGTETSVSQRTIFGEGQTNETILSGDIGIEGNNSDNCYHVFYHPDGLGLNNTAILDGFTIRGGNANGNYPHNYGGGIYNYSCSPTIKNCIFRLNLASFLGGGMINVYPSSPVILNCIFEYNTATYQGGGIYNAPNSSPTLINCTITANSSEIGGGIYSWSSSPTINNSIIWGNTATENGNQIGINSGTTTLNYSCYSNGTNDIYNSGGTFTATNNNITSDPKFVGSGEYPFLILGESPCVDAGNNTYISEEYDIRGAGYSRKLNKTTGEAGTVDMGAYEYKVNVDPLPVELSMFSAEYKMNNVILNWQTATEVNNYGFEIERSVAQISNLFYNWEKIGFVPGHGNSNSPNDYSFFDANPPSGKVQYRLKQIDTDGSFEYSQVVQVETELPKQFSLEQNYPNPFNPTTTIKYSIPMSSVIPIRQLTDVGDEVHVTLKIYDLLGREVATLVDEFQKSGTYNYQLSTSNYKLSSGVYFYQLQAGNFIATKKLILLK